MAGRQFHGAAAFYIERRGVTLKEGQGPNLSAALPIARVNRRRLGLVGTAYRVAA